MLDRFLFALRSVVAVVGGYLIVAAGTILTFNVLVGQVTVDSNPFQMILGTIGAVFAGIAGGVVAGVVAPRFPLQSWRKEPGPLGSISPEAAFSPLAFCLAVGSSPKR